jgi:hypothetical protein
LRTPQFYPFSTAIFWFQSGSFMVRVTQIYAYYRRLLHTAPLLLIKGIVQRQDGVVNLLALHIATLSQAGDSFD